jgi:hypothetical protein
MLFKDCELQLRPARRSSEEKDEISSETARMDIGSPSSPPSLPLTQPNARTLRTKHDLFRRHQLLWWCGGVICFGAVRVCKRT